MSNNNDFSINNNNTDDNNTKRKLFRFLKYFVLVLTLVILGGFIFKAIEEPIALKAIKENELKLKQVQEFFNNNETILNYLKEHYHVFDSSNYRNNWRLESSSFFAFTVATTIGYGAFAVQTPGGKLFVIIYALISIPIAGACLVVLADTVLYFMRKLIAKFTRNNMKKAFDEIDKDHSDSLDKDEVKLALKQLNMDINEDKFDKVWLEIAPSSASTSNSSNHNNNELNFEQFATLREKLHLDIDELSQQKSKVTITIVAIVVWVFISAEFISASEKWLWADSIYFTIVTLTTIGFGDYSPETNVGRLLTVLTSVIGLGLIAVLLSIIGEVIEKQSLEIQKRVSQIRKKTSSYLELVTVDKKGKDDVGEEREGRTITI